MTTNPDLCPCCQRNKLEANEVRCAACVEELGPACSFNGDCECHDCREAEDDHLESEYDDRYVGSDLDESMDGDFDSGMASAGFGTDEDYGYFGGDDGW